MGSRKIDFDGIIRFYHILSKSRPLEPHELERLLDVIDRQKVAERQAKYRAKNRVLLNAKRVELAKKNPERQAENARRYRAKNPHVTRAACAAWKLKNPELVKQHAYRSRELRRQRSAESQSSSTSSNSA